MLSSVSAWWPAGLTNPRVYFALHAARLRHDIAAREGCADRESNLLVLFFGSCDPTQELRPVAQFSTSPLCGLQVREHVANPQLQSTDVWPQGPKAGQQAASEVACVRGQLGHSRHPARAEGGCPAASGRGAGPRPLPETTAVVVRNRGRTWHELVVNTQPSLFRFQSSRRPPGSSCRRTFSQTTVHLCQRQ